MACSSMNIPTSQIVRDIIVENCTLHRSSSTDDLRKKATMRRSQSDNHLSSRVCFVRATMPMPRHSFGAQLSRSCVARAMLVDAEVDADKGLVDDGKVVEEVRNVRRMNWIEKLMELRVQWQGRQQKMKNNGDGGDDDSDDDSDSDGCPVDYDEGVEEDVERVMFDSDSFSRFLVPVPLSDARRFTKLAFLSNKAYKIAEIKAHELKLQHGLEFETSSLEKKAEAIALKAKLERDSTDLKARNSGIPEADSHFYAKGEQIITRSMAYEIAASAASHVHCHAKNDSNSVICGPSEGNREVSWIPGGCKSEIAAQMAASTMTAVVAAREREKQAAAKELQSLHSSPCDWFVCDDVSTRVRYFVIQGTESLAAWQTNLFFEPTKFEGTDTLVHRGIYEAAKGIYEQFMPEIEKHIKTHGEDAKIQLTGHSLGGSLSLLVYLMLIARGGVKRSNLLPVVTFGSPFIFCEGQKILDHLGLDEKQVHCVIMHRDIVPRAFSCSYPKHVAQILKRLNSSFRSHSCLNKHKMLYSPLGQIFILQPPEKSSPSHPLLPPGCALYALDKTESNSAENALRVFLNTPHPLETLSDPKAYGFEGSILRNHHSDNYTKAVSSVTKEYTKLAFRNVREERHLIWNLITNPSQHTWRHEADLVNGTTIRKELMTSV